VLDHRGAERGCGPSRCSAGRAESQPRRELAGAGGRSLPRQRSSPPPRPPRRPGHPDDEAAETSRRHVHLDRRPIAVAQARPGHGGGSRLPGSVTFRNDDAGHRVDRSWTGAPGIPVRPVPSVRFPVSSVLPVRSVHGAVFMVGRRSTVRFRNGTPGHGQFSNNLDDRRGTSRKRRSSAPMAPMALQGPGGSY
jgi:hypothetical protein